MDVRLSAEQEALRDSVAQVAGRLGCPTTRDLDDGERRAKLDAAVEASGWRELRAPGDDGGPLASGVEVALVAEELARGLADAAFVGPTLAADLRRRAGGSTASGRETVALTADLTGLAVHGAGSGPAAGVVVDASAADAALVLVAGDDRRLAVAEVGGMLDSVDLTRPQATIGPIRSSPDERRAGPLVDGDLIRWTALGLSLSCADLVGTMRGAAELATAYAKERRQYGAAIGSFQAVQHLLADAIVATEGSRSAARHAAWAVDALEPGDALVAATSAKAYCARAARSVCEMAIQVHGGIGNTWDCLAHVYLRRALLSIDLLGGIGPSLARVLDAAGVGGGRGLR